MTPTIHLIRHAQGYHNVGSGNHALRDPKLTPLGEEQCKLFAETFPYHDRVAKIVASPLQRTIWTAQLSLAPVVKSKDLTIIALPEIQETTDFPCDTGLDVKDLQRVLAEDKLSVDLSLLSDDWNQKDFGGKYGGDSLSISKRAREARQAIRDMVKDMASNGVDSDIAIVTHGGFLHHLSEDWEGSTKYTGTGWVNTEYRSYQFVTLAEDDSITSKKIDKPLQADGVQNGVPQDVNTGLVEFTNDYHNATMLETLESRKRRGKESAHPPRSEQERLFVEFIEKWKRDHNK